VLRTNTLLPETGKIPPKTVEVGLRAQTALLILITAIVASIPGRADDVHATLDRADELAKAGRREESNLLYREVLKSDRGCWQAYLGMGRNDFTAGKYESASAAFEKAAELQPSNPDPFYWLGRSYLQQQQPDKIMELLGRANSTIANSAQAHLLLARAHDARDEIDDAKREIGLALKVDPGFHGAHFAMGFIEWSLDELASVEEELRQELRLDPKETLAMYYLAEVLGKRGKTAEAERVLTQMGREVPNTYYYHFELGRSYERQGDNSLAAEQYREATLLDPRQPEAHYKLAIMLRALHETAQAAEEFQAFSRLETNVPRGMGQPMGRMRPRLPDFD
jgi:tetratricopeptide (TPR) repeat protein